MQLENLWTFALKGQQYKVYENIFKNIKKVNVKWAIILYLTEHRVKGHREK